MSRKRIGGWLSALAGAICLLIGVFALKWYLWDIAIGQAGEPDRSLLFWGLPVFFLGISAVGGSVGFGLLAKSLFTRPGSEDGSQPSGQG